MRAYGDVMRGMKRAGYQVGDLDHPRPGDSFFRFPHDWRRSNVDAARELVQRLDALRRVREEETLHVSLIGQSSGCRIARWIAKYGGSSLEEAEAGRGGPPPWARRRSPTARRQSERWCDALALLPAAREEVRAAPRTEVPDVFDPATWEDLGLSLHDPDVRRRMDRHPETFGTHDERAALLAFALDRARRLHRILLQDSVAFRRPRYHSAQSADKVRTPSRVVVGTATDGRPRPLFTRDREIRRDPVLSELTSTPGDGHATRASQEQLSPQEVAAFAEPTHLIRGDHFEMVLDPKVQALIVRLISESVVGGRDAGGAR